jgi:hypothetical protein
MPLVWDHVGDCMGLGYSDSWNAHVGSHNIWVSSRLSGRERLR